MPSSTSASARSSSCAARWSASIWSWVASMRRAECARYQANSTVGVPAVARSQSISTTRSPSNPRLSPRRSPWISVGAPCADRRASARVPGRSVSSSTASPTSTATSSAKASQPCSNCFGSRSGYGPLRVGHDRGGHADAVAQAGRAGRDAVVEGAMELGGRREDSAAVLAREAGVRRQQLGVDVAHRDPGGVSGSLDRHDAVADRRRHLLERASAVELRRAPAVVRGAREPVGAGGTDPLENESSAVGAARAQQRGAGIAAVAQRFDTRGADPLEQRRRHADGLAGAPRSQDGRRCSTTRPPRRPSSFADTSGADRSRSRPPIQNSARHRWATPARPNRESLPARTAPGAPRSHRLPPPAGDPPRCWCPASRRARGARAPATNPRSRPRRAKGRRERRPWPHATRARRACPRGRSRTCPQPLNAREPQPSTPCRGASLSTLARGWGRGPGPRRSWYSLVRRRDAKPLRASPSHSSRPRVGGRAAVLLFIATLSRASEAPSETTLGQPKAGISVGSYERPPFRPYPGRRSSPSR